PVGSRGSRHQLVVMLHQFVIIVMIGFVQIGVQIDIATLFDQGGVDLFLHPTLACPRLADEESGDGMRLTQPPRKELGNDFVLEDLLVSLWSEFVFRRVELAHCALSRTAWIR